MSALDWSDEAFFEARENDSIDGGTTSAGPLWHAASARWGHSMHTMCSYHGMFPAKVAHYFIQRYSRPGDLVVDPFSGRGTTVLQARLEGRQTIGNDLSPLAYVLSRAKSAPPSYAAVTTALAKLERKYRRYNVSEPDVPDDIRMLYHPTTLRQICYVRDFLLRQPLQSWAPEQLMLGGALAGIMHGAQRRDGSSQYLSISMPNTFSMSPTYVEKYIRDNNLATVDQDVFERIQDKLCRLYLDSIDGPDGKTFAEDASALLAGEAVKAGEVDLILTSPPYLRVVNYGASNWIRLWLLGVDGVARDKGSGRRALDAALDHRHNYDSYRQFMLRTFDGMARVLQPDGVAVVIIGDVADPGKDPVPLAGQIWEDIGSATDLQLLDLVEDHLPVQKKVSRIWGETKGQATNRDCALVLGRVGGNHAARLADVGWEEPYKDGGPDAAHTRLEQLRSL